MQHATTTDLPVQPEVVGLVGGAVAVALLLLALDASIARRELKQLRANREHQLANAMRAGESKIRAEGCAGCSVRLIARPRSAGYDRK